MGLDWNHKHEQSKFKIFSFLRINPGWMECPRLAGLQRSCVELYPERQNYRSLSMLEEVGDPCRNLKNLEARNRIWDLVGLILYWLTWALSHQH